MSSVMLKFLEVNDFKSYRGYHLIGPFTSFTAIIGPNGTGKSNILDAIAYAFGEHPCNMRARKVEDVIHYDVTKAPNNQYVEHGAGEVVVSVIFFVNGKEVKFTRRNVPKQSSEYSIDGERMESSTYQERLCDMGIHIKARNYRVLQGQVDTVHAHLMVDVSLDFYLSKGVKIKRIH